ncbi:MAG: serine/threonine protein kinase [Firmicutes bacterium]|nr:serine/threonine protein kinase [Bacillota bacterium]
MTEYRALVKEGHKVIRILSKKADSVVLHIQDTDDKDYILRIYSQEKKVYRVLTQRAFENMPYIRETYIKDEFFLVEEEFIDGVSLQEMVSGGARFEHDRAAQITAEVCRAAAFLHENGFIHRDIKPEHVLLTPEGRIVLIDLDSAMEIRPDKLNDTQLLGTAMYAAPEQFGLTRSDVRTDIYAIGIFLNEIVTGYHPAVKQCREGALAGIITKCISMNPEDRYQSAEDLIRALEMPKQRGKKKWVIAICAALMAVAMAATFVLLPEPPADEGENNLPDYKNTPVINDTEQILPDGLLPMYKEIQRDPVYYNIRTGCQSAPLYTENGEWIDQTYHVYADEEIGIITGWNAKYGGFTLDSTGTQTGASGYVHAEKDNLHYVIPVIVLGEPMSIYSELPDFDDIGKGYLEPEAGHMPGDSYSISWQYERNKDEILYVVLMSGFRDLEPECVNKYVTLEPFTGEVNWPYRVYKLTFNNPDGGYTPFEIRSSENIQVFRFYEK